MSACFNPCFYGTLSLTHGLRMAEEPVTVFQSLFLWNPFPDASAAPVNVSVPGFNPCFYGTLSLTMSDAADTLPVTCFNPCFYGTLSLTARILRFLSPGLVVSILVFMEPFP